MKILHLLAILLFIFTACRDEEQAAPTQAAVAPRALPPGADVIFWSTRNVDAPGPMGPSHLYVLDIEDGTVVQIAFQAHHYEHVAVSHDRRYIAATRHLNPDGSPSASVWVLDLETQAETRLAPQFFQAGNGGVDWSPDGFVYFAAQPDESGPSNLYRARPDGSQVTQLTFLEHNPRSVPPEPAIVGDVSVSADGSRLAFMRAVAVEQAGAWVLKPQIWVMNAAGGEARMVFDGGDEAGTYGHDLIGAFDPEISPDGTKIVFSRTDTAHRNFPDTVDTAHDLWIINVDGSGLRRLTQPGPASIVPDWRGDVIIYTTYDEAGNYIGLMSIAPDGAHMRRLERGVDLWDGGRMGKFLP